MLWLKTSKTKHAKWSADKKKSSEWFKMSRVDQTEHGFTKEGGEEKTRVCKFFLILPTLQECAVLSFFPVLLVVSKATLSPFLLCVLFDPLYSH